MLINQLKQENKPTSLNTPLASSPIQAKLFISMTKQSKSFFQQFIEGDEGDDVIHQATNQHAGARLSGRDTSKTAEYKYANPELKNLGSREGVVIIAHGGEGGWVTSPSLGAKSSSEMANHIAKNLPKNYSGEIYLNGCNTAVKHRGSKSFLEGFVDAMKSKGFDKISVKANLGLVATQPGAGGKSVREVIYLKDEGVLSMYGSKVKSDEKSGDKYVISPYGVASYSHGRYRLGGLRDDGGYFSGGPQSVSRSISAPARMENTSPSSSNGGSTGGLFSRARNFLGGGRSAAPAPSLPGITYYEPSAHSLGNSEKDWFGFNYGELGVESSVSKGFTVDNQGHDAALAAYNAAEEKQKKRFKFF